jgi:hypothetical protein
MECTFPGTDAFNSGDLDILLQGGKERAATGAKPAHVDGAGPALTVIAPFLGSGEVDRLLGDSTFPKAPVSGGSQSSTLRAAPSRMRPYSEIEAGRSRDRRCSGAELFGWSKRKRQPGSMSDENDLIIGDSRRPDSRPKGRTISRARHRDPLKPGRKSGLRLHRIPSLSKISRHRTQRAHSLEWNVWSGPIKTYVGQWPVKAVCTEQRIAVLRLSFPILAASLAETCGRGMAIPFKQQKNRDKENR